MSNLECGSVAPTMPRRLSTLHAGGMSVTRSLQAASTVRNIDVDSKRGHRDASARNTIDRSNLVRHSLILGLPSGIPTVLNEALRVDWSLMGVRVLAVTSRRPWKLGALICCSSFPIHRGQRSYSNWWTPPGIRIARWMRRLAVDSAVVVGEPSAPTCLSYFVTSTNLMFLHRFKSKSAYPIWSREPLLGPSWDPGGHCPAPERILPRRGSRPHTVVVGHHNAACAVGTLGTLAPIAAVVLGLLSLRFPCPELWVVVARYFLGSFVSGGWLVRSVPDSPIGLLRRNLSSEYDNLDWSFSAKQVSFSVDKAGVWYDRQKIEAHLWQHLLINFASSPWPDWRRICQVG